MLTLLVFILILSVLVLVHEFGHFIVAKIIGVKVEEFGLGYPPKLFGVKFKGTEYTLNALPFGGFVRLFGEDGEDEKTRNSAHGTKSIKSQVSSPKLKSAFYARSKLERSLILLAGVTMNFLLGVLVISILFTQGVVVPTDKVMVQEVIEKTPAYYAGIKAKDRVISINGEKVKSPADLISLTKRNAGKSTILLVNRCSETVIEKVSKLNNCADMKISIVPRATYPASEGSMGIAITNLEVRTYSVIEAPFYGTIEAFKMSYAIGKGVLEVIWQLVTQARVPQEVAGPIGIYKVTGQAMQLGGFIGVLQLLGLLSLNLAVVNILPIPALDGGRLFIVFLEVILGRKKSEKLEKMSQGIGLAIIMLLIVLITVSDVTKLETFKNIMKSVKLPF